MARSPTYGGVRGSFVGLDGDSRQRRTTPILPPVPQCARRVVRRQTLQRGPASPRGSMHDVEGPCMMCCDHCCLLRICLLLSPVLIVFSRTTVGIIRRRLVNISRNLQSGEWPPITGRVFSLHLSIPTLFCHMAANTDVSVRCSATTQQHDRF